MPLARSPAGNSRRVVGGNRSEVRDYAASPTAIRRFPSDDNSSPNCGVPNRYLDGSFTTGKPHPDDYDGCWDHRFMDLGKLDPVLLDFTTKRAAQKRKYLGEMFPALSPNGSKGTFLDFFQIEKFSGQPKGILRVTFAALKAATP